MLHVFAPAKINLCLHVTGQQSDGYHLLDSLVGFADVGDWVTVSRGGGVSVSGPQAAGLEQGENIITRVLTAFGSDDVAVHLEKHLPVASGIGGGSTDAAATYRGILALMARAPLPEDAAALLSLGADVPICVAAQPARMQGIGAQITPMHAMPALHAVLVNPRVGVSTPSVFKALSCKQNPPLAQMPATWDNQAALISWLAGQRNDLQPVAISIAPVIGDVLGAIAKTGAELARMSGSGATCFGLYATAQGTTQAAADLRAAHPDWWVAPCVINGAIATAPQAMRATT